MSSSYTKISPDKFRYIPNEREINEHSKFILEWEHRTEMDFLEVFFEDIVFLNSWACWLLGKGFNQRANFLIESILGNRSKYLDDDSKFHVNLTELCHFTEEDEIHANHIVSFSEDEDVYTKLYEMDVRLWVEFLLSTKVYSKIFLEWIEEKKKKNKRRDIWK